MAARSKWLCHILEMGKLLAAGFKHLLLRSAEKMFSNYFWDDCLRCFFLGGDGLKPAIWFYFAVNLTEEILD